MTAAEGHRELDQAAGVERASIRHRAARHAAPVGGSNRLLSVEELIQRVVMGRHLLKG